MTIKRKTCYYVIGFFCFIAGYTSGQDQKIADSLVKIYKGYKPDDEGKLELLRNLAFNEVNDLELSLTYAEELISLSKKQENNLYLYRGYLQKGNKKRLLGNLEEALDAFFKSREAAKKAHYIPGEGTAYGAIADIYSLSNHHDNAMLYYNKAIATLRQSTDSIALAAAISNAGDEFLNNKNYDSALLYFNESGALYNKLDYSIGKAYNLGNIGLVHANSGEHDLAEKNINESIRVLEELEDYYPICVYLIAMADIYRTKEDTRSALNYAQRSLTLAQQYGMKEQIGDAHLKLSELYEKTGNTGKSLSHYKNHIVYRDSINNIRSVQKMADLRTNFEVSQKQVEVDLLHEQKRNQHIIQISSILIFSIITAGLLFLIRQNKKSNKKLTAINETISEMNASKDKLFSIISHDIKGPLNSLLLFSKLLINDSLKLTQDEINMLSRNFDKSLKNLLALLENLLEWSLSQTGHIDFKPERFDFALVLNENLALLKEQAQQKNITIINENEATLPVNAHYHSINTIVRNLMSNAIKFTPKGGKITLQTRPLGNELQVSVIDTGLGISSDALQKIFKIDTKHSTPGTANEKGTGLGLILCKDFAEKNGGTIGVESTEGAGSTFYFTIPMATE